MSLSKSENLQIRKFFHPDPWLRPYGPMGRTKRWARNLKVIITRPETRFVICIDMKTLTARYIQCCSLLWKSRLYSTCQMRPHPESNSSIIPTVILAQKQSSTQNVQILGWEYGSHSPTSVIRERLFSAHQIGSLGRRREQHHGTWRGSALLDPCLRRAIHVQRLQFLGHKRSSHLAYPLRRHGISTRCS